MPLNNPLKSYYNPNTPDTYCKCTLFLIEKPVSLKIIGAQNQLSIPFFDQKSVIIHKG